MIDYSPPVKVTKKCFVCIRDVEAEAGSRPFSVEAEAGNGPFSVEAEARKFYGFRFHIGGKNRERKEIGSAILRRRPNRGSTIIKK